MTRGCASRTFVVVWRIILISAFFLLPTPSSSTQAGLHHYARVKGRNLPNTAALLAKWRPEGLVLYWGYGTFTHWGAECVAPLNRSAAPDPTCWAPAAQGAAAAAAAASAPAAPASAAAGGR